MIPSPWEFFLLAAGAFRVLRLIGWDDFPPVAKTRAWLLGEEWILPEGEVPEPPGKSPDMSPVQLVPTYRRPLLAHLVHCPWCIGWWISFAVMAAWWVFPTATVVVLLPFALSGVIGLVAKNLDA